MTIKAGIVAAQSRSLEASSPLPFGAVAYLDFIGQYYYADGTQRAAMEVVSEPSRITANGLEILNQADGVVDLLSPVLADLTGGSRTIVIEYEELWADGDTQMLVMDGPDDNWRVQRYHTGSNRYMELYDVFDGFDYRFLRDTDLHGAGTHKIAVTRTATKAVMSVDGDAIISDTDPSPAPVPPDWTNASFGGWPGDGWPSQSCHIRSLTIYPAQADEALPGLSAL